ncbi:MAG: hypothetical protein QME05_00100 [Candidatus Margulisbacteria bacterium]|nr:hypothetical protein [Candidatus Margulisiibacteriota bacterium]
MNLRVFLTFATCCLTLFCFAFTSYAWVITKELKKELAEKTTYVKKNPKDPEAQFELAVTQGYTNHLLEGMSSLKKVNDIDPQFKLEALEIYFNKVLEDPNDWKLRFRLAFIYYFNDRYPEAIRELNNVLIIDPYNVWAMGYLALLYGYMNEVDKAIAITKQALKVDSNVAALHLLLGEGYAKKGNGWGAFRERLEAVRLKSLGY